jgi:MFS family permease
MSVMALPGARRTAARTGIAALWAFAAVAVALGAARAVTTTYVPVLLERIADRPGLIGAVMLVNAAAGFVVPLATGVWSDRSGTRGPFIVGGAIIAAGGLVAVALGTASSYAVLGVAAATVYIGLNAASTAHRALVAERFPADRRAAATGAQEGAMLAGALAGTVVGGVLIDTSAAGMFVLFAIALPLLALPTLAWQRAAAPGREAAQGTEGHGSALALFGEILRRDGARQVLVAQVLWVAAYAALAPFMVLYAEEVLGLRAAAAGALLAAFGVLTGLGMIAGARLHADALRHALLAGVALLGGGLLAATAASTVAQAALPFAAAALGAGLVSSVGLPYFTRFVPERQAGRYAGAFFSERAIASTAALPAAGALIAATGSYRALLGMGVLGLVALIPLARAERALSGGVTVPATVALPPIRRVTAVIPAYRSERVGAVTEETLRHVDAVVLVDDGASPAVAAQLTAAARDPRVRVVALGGNHGKGTAVSAGIDAALALGTDAVMVLDSDGQHPPELIPRFVAAAEHADVVIGDRGRPSDMPWLRRLANGASSGALSLAVRRRLRDTQNGMRLMRAGALRAVPCRWAATRPRPAVSKRSSAAAAPSTGSRCLRSTRASRARSARSPTPHGCWARSSGGPVGPRPDPHRHRRPRRCAPWCANGRRGSGSACCSPGPSPPRSRCCQASTRASSSPSTRSATGRSGCTRRSTRTAALSRADGRRVAGRSSRLAPVAVRGRRAARHGARRRVRRPRPRSRAARREPASARRGPRRRGRAQPRPALGPHPLVSLRPPDRDHRAGRGRRRHGAPAPVPGAGLRGGGRRDEDDVRRALPARRGRRHDRGWQVGLFSVAVVRAVGLLPARPRKVALPLAPARVAVSLAR